MDTLEVTYRLPVTTVTVVGTQTTTVNDVVTPRTSTTRASALALEIAADAQGERTLTVLAPRRSTHSVTVALAPDDRLTSVNAVAEDQSGEQVKAALQVGLSTAGALVPLLAPLGPIGAGVAAAAALAAGGATYVAAAGPAVLGDGAAAARPGAVPPQRPPAAELGINHRYVKDHAHEAETLAGLRWSEMVLTAHLATATTDAYAATGRPTAQTLASTLRHLTRSLASIRGELTAAEGRYASWVATQASITHTRHHRAVYTLDQLPSTSQLRHAAREGFPHADDGWVRLFEDLRVAITCDLEAGSVSSTPPKHPDPGPSTIVYRRPVLATITTWSIGRDSNGDYQLTADTVERKVVVLRGSEAVVHLAHGRDDVSASADFDSDGLLSKVGVDRGDSRTKTAQLLGSAPALAKDAFAAGSALTQPWTNADRAAELKSQLELLENQQKLAKARGPSAPDPLQGLRAQTIIDEPTRSLRLLRTTEPG